MWYETLLAEFSFGLLGIVAAMQSSEESISAQSNSDNKTLRPTCSTIAAYTLLLRHKSNRNTNLTFMSLISYSFLYWGKKKIEFDLNGFETKCSLCNIVTLLLSGASLWPLPKVCLLLQIKSLIQIQLTAFYGTLIPFISSFTAIIYFPSLLLQNLYLARGGNSFTLWDIFRQPSQPI